jgi:hypothetical protein
MDNLGDPRVGDALGAEGGDVVMCQVRYVGAEEAQWAFEGLHTALPQQRRQHN